MSSVNDPNSAPENPTTEKQQKDVEENIVSLRNQIDLTRQLNDVFNSIGQTTENISTAINSQSDFLNQMSVVLSQVNDSMAMFSSMSQEISQNIQNAANQIVENWDQRNFERMNNNLTQISQAAENGITSQSQAFSNLADSTQNFGNTSSNFTEEMRQGSEDYANSLGQTSNHASNLSKTTRQIQNGLQEVGETAEDVNAKVSNLKSGFLGTISSLIKGSSGLIGMVTNGMSSLLGAAKNFVSFSLTMPFTIMQEAANIGNTIRTDLVEVIGNAAEALKEKFDLSSSIGEGIRKMTADGKSMLMEFQSPSSEMVKLFGYGAEGIASMIGFMGENIESMGHFSEIFGKSIMGNRKNLKEFTKMVKGFGFSSEDVYYLSMDAANNLKHVNTRMKELGVTLTTVSEEYGVDRKRLSKNFMILRKDITQFGHLSDEEIARTTAKLTHMKVKLEDAAAVFKKFSTFEDAANSVAMLSQTFGMNLDAMDIIQAKNPEEIIDMFRNSMMMTGRSFQDLNRFEKELMVQHTGISAESLSALMRYRDMGDTFEEAKKKMEAAKPEAKQMKALKDLNSALKETQKVMSFTSPFKAFLDGLMNNMTLTGDLKNSLLSLSSGYEGIYNYAKSLDKKTFEGLIKPIQMIINIMTEIFESDAFRGGLTSTLKAISSFVGDMFGVTSTDMINSRLVSNIRSVTESKKYSKGTKDYFEASVTQELKNKINEKKDLLQSAQALDFQKLSTMKDPVEILKYLKSAQKSAKDNPEIFNAIRQIHDNIVSSLTSSQITTTDGKVNKAFTTAADRFKNNVVATFSENKENISKVKDLGGGVMGAIIKGAATGFLALFKLLNKGIDFADALNEGGGDKQINSIANFLKIDPKELKSMGKELTSAAKGLFDRRGALFSLSSVVLEGFKEVFGVLFGFFASAFMGAFNSIFGGLNVGPKVAFRAMKLDKKGQEAAPKNINVSLEKGKDIKATDAASLYYLLEDQIKQLESKEDREFLMSRTKDSKEKFKSSKGTQADIKTSISETSMMLQAIKDRNLSEQEKTNLKDFNYLRHASTIKKKLSEDFGIDEANKTDYFKIDPNRFPDFEGNQNEIRVDSGILRSDSYAKPAYEKFQKQMMRKQNHYKLFQLQFTRMMRYLSLNKIMANHSDMGNISASRPIPKYYERNIDALTFMNSNALNLTNETIIAYLQQIQDFYKANKGKRSGISGEEVVSILQKSRVKNNIFASEDGKRFLKGILTYGLHHGIMKKGKDQKTKFQHSSFNQADINISSQGVAQTYGSQIEDSQKERYTPRIATETLKSEKFAIFSRVGTRRYNIYDRDSIATGESSLYTPHPQKTSEQELTKSADQATSGSTLQKTSEATVKKQLNNVAKKTKVDESTVEQTMEKHLSKDKKLKQDLDRQLKAILKKKDNELTYAEKMIKKAHLDDQAANKKIQQSLNEIDRRLGKENKNKAVNAVSNSKKQQKANKVSQNLSKTLKKKSEEKKSKVIQRKTSTEVSGVKPLSPIKPQEVKKPKDKKPTKEDVEKCKEAMKQVKDTLQQENPGITPVIDFNNPLTLNKAMKALAENNILKFLSNPNNTKGAWYLNAQNACFDPSYNVTDYDRSSGGKLKNNATTARND
tara:strand:+ start:24707 stop:29557 length:4851 start_codon:yes stop_codon:yes gene_type:complete